MNEPFIPKKFIQWDEDDRRYARRALPLWQYLKLAWWSRKMLRLLNARDREVKGSPAWQRINRKIMREFDIL